VHQRGDRRTLIAKEVIQFGCPIGGQLVKGDFSRFKHLEGGGMNLKSPVDPLGENHDGSSVRQELFDIRDLDTGIVARAGHGPIPGFCPAWEKHGVFIFCSACDSDITPR
jgi:hypothetical protein